MIVDVVRSASFINICRVRQLPLPGRVLVEPAQSVSSQDIIAVADVPNQVLFLDLARGLGLSAEDAVDYVVREPGATLQRGDVVAQFQGAFTRLVRAPIDGQLVDVNEGKAVLMTGTEQVSVRAGMLGQVESLIPEFGAVVINRGALIQGAWGNGRMGDGVLTVAAETPAVALTEEDVEGAAEDALLVGGICLHASVLEAAAERLSGLILGALAPELKSLAKTLDLPVIVLNGFGLLPIDPANFALLNEKSGFSASLNASSPNLFNHIRPEVIIPLEGELDPKAQKFGFRVELDLGQRVRVLSGAAQGQIGEVVDLPSALFRFESGLNVRAARVRLHGGQMVNVPLRNLEVMA